MGTPSPLNADGDLFAVKGRAVPMDETRSEEPTAPRPGPAPEEPSPVIAPLPGIFIDDADDAPVVSADADQGIPQDAEPPPAASLLTIAAQESAARSRLKSREPSAPIDDEEDSKPVVPNRDQEPDQDAVEESARETRPNLPVPVPISLPVALGTPDSEQGHPRRRLYLVAASVAGLFVVAVAASLAVTEPAPDQTPAPPNVAAALPAKPDASTIEQTAPSVPAQKPATLPKAKIDSVTFGNAGRAIVTGRAEPGSDLVILRGRQPLGSARADTTGRWQFMTRVPARIERHEISVAALRIDTTVTVDKPVFVPKPQRRPPSPPAPGTSYFVQISSLPSAEDARRQAGKLTTRLSGVFPPNRIHVRAATIGEGRTVYRVAIGGFTSKTRANAACDKIQARNAPCLVMREP